MKEQPAPRTAMFPSGIQINPPSLVLHLLLPVMFALLALGGCTGSHPEFSELQAQTVIHAATPARSGCTQVVVVLGHNNPTPANRRFVTVSVFEAATAAGPFTRVLGPYASTVGTGGFAPPGQKREGDKRSPTGRFTITELFGEDPDFRPRLPYKVVGPDDAWCEDPTSPLYNQWLTGTAAAAATDRLRRDDDLYFHAAVIDYNRWPVVPGAGSAIFMHRAHPDGAGTLGCVGLDADDLKAVLLRLDPARQPEIIMGSSDDLFRPSSR